MGLIRVNGEVKYDAAFRLGAGDFVQLEHLQLVRFRHFFQDFQK